MFLTENSIQDIFLTGNLKNSALAEEFHKQLHEKYKIQVFVSYYCEETQNSLTLLVRTDDQSTIRVSQNHNLLRKYSILRIRALAALLPQGLWLHHSYVTAATFVLHFRNRTRPCYLW